MSLLEAERVTKRFGGLSAVRELDFTVEPGSIVSVIGPNGAGKTTFFNCIAGFYHPEEGQITFDGMPIHHLRRDQIAHLGIARTYQNIRLFAKMTAIENILVGQHFRLHGTWIGAVLNTAGVQAEEVASHDEARRLLQFVGLRARDVLATSCHMAKAAWSARPRGPPSSSYRRANRGHNQSRQPR
jgi:branched-chain amino acid transport system ATP-binding protein